MTPWPPGIFVVGTDTGVGKTRVAAAIARTWMRIGRRVGVIKPVSTGGRQVDGRWQSADVTTLIAAISTPGSPFPSPPADLVGPLVSEAPLAPPVAARQAGDLLLPSHLTDAVDDSIRWWTEVGQAEFIVLEGVGGLLCPVAEGGYTVADLAAHLNYPILIVAYRGLGTLNHTLLTVEAARSRGLRIAGIILNATRPVSDPLAESTNAAELAGILPGIPILADWGYDPAADRVPVGPEAGHWISLAQTPRPVPGRGSSHRSDASSVLLNSDDDLPVGAASKGLIGTSTTSATVPGDSTRSANPDPSPSSSGFSGLDLDLTTAARSTRPHSPGQAETDEAAPGSSWRNVLLVSYASAVTLALGWTLYQNRQDRRPGRPLITLKEDAAPKIGSESGQLGDRSRRVAELKPIPVDRLIRLGESRQIDSLLVEPIAVERRNLTLERVNLAGKTERRDGGKRAVLLRVRLQNRSPDRVFAPVDPSFVRGRSDDVYETLLELDDGRKVYPDPLAVNSEWTVVGESFADLRPGESREVTFATEPNAPADIERLPATWRIKLRTGTGDRSGQDRTAEVGVRLPGVANP